MPLRLALLPDQRQLVAVEAERSQAADEDQDRETEQGPSIVLDDDAELGQVASDRADHDARAHDRSKGRRAGDQQQHRGDQLPRDAERQRQPRMPLLEGVLAALEPVAGAAPPRPCCDEPPLPLFGGPFVCVPPFLRRLIHEPV